MGADIKKLRGRIKSIDSTLHLTKAMGLVASSKIKRATEAMLKGREYENAINDGISALAGSSECRKSPYMQKRDTHRLCLIVIAGDRGLAGGYNANLFRLAREYEAERVIPIGKRACEKYGKEIKLAEDFSYTDAAAMAREIASGFCEGEFDQVGIICTKYVSIMSQEAQIKWILPLEQREDTPSHSVLFEPDEMTILNAAIFEYLAARIVAAVRESYASEVAARRFAMDSAGKNAQQMLDDLQLKYNRARQGAITQEITEIVAGSDV
ncbi:MAG: ATP synthase F1 subunit gamma [Clostridia bacterium]|nr:ATP synthase F1 subunit gamma [Clostridia bacterium]